MKWWPQFDLKCLPSALSDIYQIHPNLVRATIEDGLVRRELMARCNCLKNSRFTRVFISLDLTRGRSYCEGVVSVVPRVAVRVILQLVVQIVELQGFSSVELAHTSSPSVAQLSRTFERDGAVSASPSTPPITPSAPPITPSAPPMFPGCFWCSPSSWYAFPECVWPDSGSACCRS